MILEFFFKNYASFKDEQHFSLLASSKKENFPKSEDNITRVSDDLKVLKTAVVYGSNASGKSNFLNAFSTRRKTADFAGFIIYNKNEEMCFGFGKHKGKKVTDVLAHEPGYFGWVLNADFPLYTKKLLTEIRLQALNTKTQ